MYCCGEALACFLCGIGIWCGSVCCIIKTGVDNEKLKIKREQAQEQQRQTELFEQD